MKHRTNVIHKKNDSATKVVCVTGGKGGVGKTFIAINLATSLAHDGHNVLLFDGDLSLANIDVLLGLSVKYNMADVMAGYCDLTDIILRGPGFDILPASSGRREMTRLTAMENAGIIAAFNTLTQHYDTLLLDTAAGISDTVIQFARASQEVIVVLCNEPSSMTDAYALIKSLHREDTNFKFHIIANMVHNEREGHRLFDKMSRVTSRFLDVDLRYMGAVFYDEYVRRAIKKRSTLLDVFPGSQAARQIERLARQIHQWPMSQSASGSIEFFVEQLVGC